LVQSSCPFRAPHIVIDISPPYFTPPEENKTPLIQDAAHGQLLTVPSPLVEVINDPRIWIDDWSNFSEDDLFDDVFSRPDTPLPLTPIDEEMVEFDYMAEKMGVEGSLASEMNDCGEMTPYCVPILQTENALAALFTFGEGEDDGFDTVLEDEEDEGLPPFDEWYTQSPRTVEIR
jgi:hypothetical protein